MTDTYAVVGKLKLNQIDGAKTLQVGFYGGLPYAVGKDITEDDLVLIFIPDGQISEEFTTYHDLIARNDPETGKRANNGYLAKNRKVRSITLMQGKIKSVGLVMSLKSLEPFGDISKLTEGDSFNEFNGYPICNKYVNPETLRYRHGDKTQKRRVKKEYIGIPEHPDTQQFYKFGKTLQPGDLITISLKCDGTSVRVANAFEIRKPNLLERLLSKIGLVTPAKFTNSSITGTRRVIIEETTGAGWYGSHDMYVEVGRMLGGKLYPGEAVYGEIVGWQSETTPLFNRGGVIFKYGCEPGKRDFYVYNIVHTLPNGVSYDLPWSQIKARCFELGVKHVLEMDVQTDAFEYVHNGQFIYDGDLPTLEKLVYSMVEGQDLIDPSHIREGVVLRVEGVDGHTRFMKVKSEAYYALEDKSKNEGQVDIEEAQDVSNMPE